MFFLYTQRMEIYMYYPYTKQTTNPPNHKESINVRIRGELYFFQPIRVSVTKQVRNSYEYSWDLAGFGPSRHDTVPNSQRCSITYLEILQ